MNTIYTDKSSRITSDVVKRANEKLIREGVSRSTTPIHKGYSVTVEYKGEVISQYITKEKVNSDFKKSVEATKSK